MIKDLQTWLGSIPVDWLSDSWVINLEDMSDDSETTSVCEDEEDPLGDEGHEENCEFSENDELISDPNSENLHASSGYTSEVFEGTRAELSSVEQLGPPPARKNQTLHEYLDNLKSGLEFYLKLSQYF